MNAKSRLNNKHGLSTEKQKEKFIASYDWNRMTMQDESVWDKIFAFLEG